MPSTLDQNCLDKFLLLDISPKVVAVIVEANSLLNIYISTARLGIVLLGIETDQSFSKTFKLILFVAISRLQTSLV